MTPVARKAPTDVAFHPTYNGVVLFRNTFDGKLPATDYSKVNVSSPAHLHKHACKHTVVLSLHVFCICTVWFRLGVHLLQTPYRTFAYSGA